MLTLRFIVFKRLSELSTLFDDESMAITLKELSNMGDDN